MASIRWDKNVKYKNYKRDADGFIVPDIERTIQIAKFQPSSNAEVRDEDGTISREYLCIASIQPNIKEVDRIQRGAEVVIDKRQYIVSNIEPFEFEGNVSNNVSLTLRQKLRISSG